MRFVMENSKLLEVVRRVDRLRDEGLPRASLTCYVAVTVPANLFSTVELYRNELRTRMYFSTVQHCKTRRLSGVSIARPCWQLPKIKGRILQ